MSIGIIRVFTTDEHSIINAHGEKINEFSGINCLNKCIPDQPKGIYDDESEEIAIPKIIEVAKKFEKNKEVKGIAISCAADPALKAVRQEVSIPVVGAGSCASYMAKIFSDKIGVLTIADEVPEVMENMLGDSLVAWEKPKNIHNTADLLKDGAIEESLQSVRKLIEKGSEVIVFACTGYVTIGFSDIVEKELNIKVIDPVVAEGHALSFILRGA